MSQQLSTSVWLTKKYHDYKAKLDGKAVVIVGEDLILADRTRECAVMDGKVEGLKNALRELYSKYEIKLFTDAATLHYMDSYEEGEFDGELDCDEDDDEESTCSEPVNDDFNDDEDADDQCDEESEEDNAEGTSSIDSTSQAIYGRRYEEVKRAEKEYEKAKQSGRVNDMQDAVKDNVD